MTVIERLYDNAWYVAHAAPGMREALEADVTRTWMAREAALDHAKRVRTVAGVSPGRSALALSLGNASQAEYDRARARASEAARCTDIVGGHAFAVQREAGPDGSMTMEVSSCTLTRRVSLSRAGRDEAWVATMHDPRSRLERFQANLGPDPWDALHRACDWITTGTL
jgi:hypothetical protein